MTDLWIFHHNTNAQHFTHTAVRAFDMAINGGRYHLKRVFSEKAAMKFITDKFVDSDNLSLDKVLQHLEAMKAGDRLCLRHSDGSLSVKPE